MGDKSTSTAIGFGDVHLSIIVNGSTSIFKLREVLHVPPFVFSLLSVSTLTSWGLSIQFTKSSAHIFLNESLLAKGSRVGNLYVVDLEPTVPQVEAACLTTLHIWNGRLAHVKKPGY